MADRKLEVILTGDSKRLEAALGRGEKKVHSFGAAGVAAGALIAGGLAVAVRDVVGDFLEGEKGAAQTAAVIKSTGGAAGVTAKQVDTLATSIRNKTGIDDDSVTAGENMLLTFTNVRNEVGAGNDIFNQATQAAANMSVALGKDMPSASMMLGKALNDPVAGMAKLGRAGVQFTQAQKDQVAAMVKAGDTAGAQKVILAELTKEFGGSADAAGNQLGGQLSILKGKAEDMGGTLLSKIIPALTDMAKFLGDNSDILTALAPVIGIIVAGWIAYEAATKIAAVAQTLLNLSMDANPIGLIVLAITGLIAGLVLLYQNSSTARAIIDAAMSGIKSAALAAFGWITDTAVPAVIGAWNSMHPVIEALKTIIMAHFNVIKSAIQTAISIIVPLLHGDFGGALDAAKAAVASLKDKVVSVLGAIPGVIRAAIPIIGSAALAVGSKVFSSIVSGIGDLAGMIGDKAGDLKDGLVKAAVSVVGKAKAVGAAILGGIKDGVGDLAGWIEGKAKAAVNGVIHLFNGAVRTVTSRINSALTFSVDTHIPGIGTVTINPPDIGAPQIPTLAEGGIVTRPTLALIGEAGPEMVMPLSGSGMGSPTFIFHEVAADADPVRIAAAAVWRLRAMSR